MIAMFLSKFISDSIFFSRNTSQPTTE